MTGSTTDEQGAFRCRRTRNPRLISIVALAIGDRVRQWHIRVNEPIADEMMDGAERFYLRVDSGLLTAGDCYTRVRQTTLTAARRSTQLPMRN
jgi:hypothetical protein